MKSKRQSVTLATVMFLNGLLLTPVAFAFKPRTHVWVAQQVLNDVVPDGLVTIEPFGDFVVPAPVVEALRTHPDEYRMGLIGPDGFPDPVVGQTTVHPGVPIPNDEWLAFVLARAQGDNASRAFAYGFLGHAASDIFAHSWVNLYTGDFFTLEDGQEEEIRHMALEDYVSRATPAMMDAGGSPLGAYEQAIRVPSGFARQVLMIDATQHYRAVPSAQHIVAMVEIRNIVSHALEEVESLDGSIRAAYLAPALSTIRLGEEAIRVAQGHADDLLRRKAQLEQRAEEIPKLIENIDAEIRRIQREIEDRASQAIRDGCVVSCCAAAAGVGCALEGVRNECNNSCNEVYNALQGALNAQRTTQDQLRNETTEIATELAGLPARITTAQANLQAATVDTGLKIAREVRQRVEALLAEIDPVRGILKLWVGDMDAAMDAYILAGQETAQTMVRGDGSLIGPYQRWLSCWAPVFQGVPSVAAQAPCVIHDLLNEFQRVYEDLRAALGSAIWLIDPIGETKREAVKKIKPEIEKAAERGVREVLGLLGRKDFAEALELLSSGADRDRLNAIFARDDSGKALLEFPDVASRIDTELSRTGDVPFDPRGFHTAFNAVQLAKLALLDESGISDLISRATGSPVPIPSYARLNILMGFAKSIDGNHQWQRQAPPYFRQDGYFPRERSEYREFGYGVKGSDDDGKGFVLWRNSQLRRSTFEKLFKGPLAPALENPCMRTFPDVIHASYPYRTCARVPFANIAEESSKACGPELVVLDVDLIYDPATIEWVRVKARVANQGGRGARARLRSEILPPEMPADTSDASGAARRERRSTWTRIHAERSSPAVICGGEEKYIEHSLVVGPYLPGGSYRLKVLAFIDDLVSDKPFELFAPDGLSISPCQAEHRVRRGETLEGIARRYGVSPWRVSARNRTYNLNLIVAGRTLCIPQED